MPGDVRSSLLGLFLWVLGPCLPTGNPLGLATLPSDRRTAVMPRSGPGWSWCRVPGPV